MTDDVDTDRVDQTILALLWLNLKVTGAAWKGFDWEAMERLHGRGLISNPVSYTHLTLPTNREV